MFHHRRMFIARYYSDLLRRKRLILKYRYQQDVKVDGDYSPTEEDIYGQNLSLSDYIESMSAQQRKIMRQNNPELPLITFMTKKEKMKFFNKKNQQFNKGMKKIQKRRKTNYYNKNVKFQDKFEVRIFDDNQKSNKIRITSSVKEKYKPDIHFS